MKYRNLGDTGIKISIVSFGAGPVPALMTEDSHIDIQRRTVLRAIESGINWFDTAATYGNGKSEENLGLILRELDAQNKVNVATKVRLMPEQLDNIGENVKNSVLKSLERLQMERVTLIQIHNSITQNRGDQYTSITPKDVLGKKGILNAFEKLESDGLARYLGLTGLGDVSALMQVIKCGEFDTIQVCYNMLNRSAGEEMSEEFDGINYGNIITECINLKMGIIAIRVLAGGALAGQPPSEYTLTAKVFPLAIYEKDMERAQRLAKLLPPWITMKEAAIRFVLNQKDISTALIGFSEPKQVDEIVKFCSSGPLSQQEIESITLN